MHVPVDTKVTAPIDESTTVQIPVVELVYDFVPAPALAVDVTVGGVAVNTYEDEYEPESILKVRAINGVLLMLNVLVDEAADAYPKCAATVAEIEQSPVDTKVTAPLDEFTVHTEEVELEYVIDPSPAERVANIVGALSLKT